MSDDTIMIYIKGTQGSGKSLLADQIARMLEEEGMPEGSAKYVRCVSTNGGLSNAEEEGVFEFHFTDWKK